MLERERALIKQAGYERPNQNGDAQPHEADIAAEQVFATLNYRNNDVQDKSQCLEDNGRTHAMILASTVCS